MPLLAALNKKDWALLTIAALAVIITFFLNPIPQDPAYHQFADQRTLWGITNALNVLSNVPFIAVGGAGAVMLTFWLMRHGPNALLAEYLFFFIGTAFAGVGSLYYHNNPANDSLFWDRLPMAVSFLSFFSSVISERVSRKAGGAMLLPLLAFGTLSVLTWAWGEEAGKGDLRMYAFVQFVPLALIISVLVLYPSPRNYRVPVVSLLVCYGAAKVCEVLDRPIYAAGTIVSGHTLKHLFAALGVSCILKMLYDRRRELAPPGRSRGPAA